MSEKLRGTRRPKYSEGRLGQELEKIGDGGKALTLAKPMVNNPSDCATYESILSDDNVRLVMDVRGSRWTALFMHLMNSIHRTHNAPDKHPQM